jgi:hypothetical protein
VAAIEVAADALDAVAARLHGAGTALTSVAADLRSGAAGVAGHPRVAAGLEALTTRLDQTMPALADGHTGFGRSVAAAADRYRTTEANIDRTMVADTGPPATGLIGQASVAGPVAAERWGDGLMPTPRETPA